MNRVLRATRMQTVGWQYQLAVTWGNLLGVFAINLLIFMLIRSKIEDKPVTGALATIYIVAFVIGIRTLTQVLPFSMALSLTRRTFYLAALLVALGESVLYGVLLYLCKLLEGATGGWGLDLAFFGVPFLVQHNPLLQILVYAVPLIALRMLGLLIGAVYKRWGMTGAFASMLVSALALGISIAAITLADSWLAVGHWFADQPILSLLAGWPAVLALACAGAGYLITRRSTP